MKATDILGLPYQPGEADKLGVIAKAEHKWWLVSGQSMVPATAGSYWQCSFGCCTAGRPVSAGPFDTEEDALYLGHKIEIAMMFPPGAPRSEMLTKNEKEYNLSEYRQLMLVKHGYRAIRGVDV